VNTGNQHEGLSLKLALICLVFPSIPEEMQTNLWRLPWNQWRQTRNEEGSLCQVTLSLTARGCMLM